MKIDLKKVLLAGTAIVAASAFTATAAQAQANITLAADGLWASSANQTSAAIEFASAGDNVDVNGNSLFVSDNTITPSFVGQPNDGGGAGGPFTLGAITDSGAGDLIVLQSTGALTATIGSVAVGDVFYVSGANTGNAVNVAVTGAATVGGEFTVDNSAGNTGANDDVNVSIGGALTVTGPTQITGGILAAGGATTNVIVNGNAAFTGAVTIDGGANNAGNTANLTLRGATNTFTAGATLDDNTGVAQLQVDGTVAQTVTGNIFANNDNEGALILGNTSTGSVFTGDIGSLGAAGNAIGAITLNSAGNNSAATFQGFVDSQAITIGDAAGAETHTLTFNSSGNRTVTGTIAGDGAGNDTANVVVSGGGTLTTTGIWGAGNAIDNLSITGSSTLAQGAAAINATNTTIGSGSTLQMNNAINGAVDGASAGVGTLQSVTGATLTGAIGAVNPLAAILIDAGQTLTTTAAISATTTTLSGAGSTLVIGAGNNAVTTNVVATVDQQGVVNVADGAGTTTITGNIGSSTSSLATFGILGAGTAQTVTTTGSIYANAIGFTNAADSLTFLGDGSVQFVSGILNGGGAGQGDLVFGSGTSNTSVTFNNFVGAQPGGNTLSDATVNTMATVTFQSAATFAGNLTNDGTVNVEAGNTVAVGGILAGGAGGGTYNIGVNRQGLATATNSTVGTHTGLITNGGAAASIAADTVALNIEGGALIAETLQNVITGVNAAPTCTDTALINLTCAIDGGNNLDITIALVSLNTLATTTSNANAANTILTDPTLVASTNADVLALQAALQNAPTQQAFNDTAEQAMSTVDGSNVVATLNVINNSFSIVGDRLASIRTGDSVTGMTTGNLSEGVRAWAQAFGSTGEQDDRDGVDGYDFDTYGFAVGADTENIAENTVLGIAFTYADTEADSDNGSATNTEIDSYQFTIYGEHDFRDDVYLNGMVAYTHNETDTSRLVLNNTASGQFDASTFTARAEVGRDYSYEGATLTPHVLAHWSHYDPDSYTETGTGAALRVTGDELNIVELGVGVDVNWLLQNSDGSYFSPELSVAYRHDFADDEVAMTNQFVAGGAAFQVQGFDPQQDTVDLGAGMTYFSTDNWELTAEYDFEWKEDFESHSGMVRAAYRF